MEKLKNIEKYSTKSKPKSRKKLITESRRPAKNRRKEKTNNEINNIQPVKQIIVSAIFQSSSQEFQVHTKTFTKQNQVEKR